VNHSILSYPRALTLTAAHLLAAAGALAGSDFNGDGFSDLAISAPGETINGLFQAGQVHVMYGSANGVSAVSPLPDQVFHQDTPGVNQTLEGNDRFGDALATGDFNGDGFDDLAIGSPFEKIVIGGVEHPQAGVVNILYGSAQGLTAAGDQDFIQGSEGIEGVVEDFDWFGAALAAGDFDHDGFDDLAVGVPFQDVGSQGMAGAVHVIYGSGTGLNGSRDRIYTQDSSGILDSSEEGDQFGATLAAADFGNDGYCDLAIGIPFEDIVVDGANRSNAGMVHVIYGSATGLGTDDEVWHQDSTGVPGAVQAGDNFGRSLAAGVDGSSAILAIGAPGDDDATNGSGSVTVLLSSIKSDRLTSTGSRRIRLQDLGIAGITAEDRFGASIAMGDFGRSFQNGDLFVGGLDLAIGCPERKVTRADGTVVFGAGSVFIAYRNANGWDLAGEQLLAQGVSGLSGAPENGDNFGAALAVGRFNGGSRDSLVIGAQSDSDIEFRAGCIHILPGSNSGLSIANAQHFTQNSANVNDSCESSDAFGASLGAR
jgi:hypothetical protein